MQLSDKSVKVLDGAVVLTQRKRSSAWQARYKIGCAWIRTSTKERDLDKAKVVAKNLYLRAHYREVEGLPIISKKFSAVAKQVITKMQSELDAGHGRSIYNSYITAIEKYLTPYYGNHNIDRIDMKLIKGFEAFRRTINNQDIKASTQQTYNAAMSHIFKEAVERGYMMQAQVPMLENKAVVGERRPDFTLDEYNRLVSFMDLWITNASNEKSGWMRQLLRDYVVVLANTGMRPGEESNRLRWNQLRWLNTEGKQLLYISVSSKKGKDGKIKNRECVVKPAAIDAFKRLHAASPDLSSFSFEQLTQQKSDQYVFRLANGARTINLNQTFEQLLTDSGLLIDPRTGTKRTLYSLRHCYATISLLDGVSFAFLEAQMGTSLAMLTAHYNHLTTQQAGAHLARPLGTSATAAVGVIMASKSSEIVQDVLSVATNDFGAREIEVDRDGVVRLAPLNKKPAI